MEKTSPISVSRPISAGPAPPASDRNEGEGRLLLRSHRLKGKGSTVVIYGYSKNNQLFSSRVVRLPASVVAFASRARNPKQRARLAGWLGSHTNLCLVPSVSANQCSWPVTVQSITTLDFVEHQFRAVGASVLCSHIVAEHHEKWSGVASRLPVAPLLRENRSPKVMGRLWLGHGSFGWSKKVDPPPLSTSSNSFPLCRADNDGMYYILLPFR